MPANNLAGKRVVVTGGAGFVGSYVIENLIAQDVAEIIVIDNLMRGSKENLEGPLSCGRVKLIEGDIRDTQVLKENFLEIDYCVHLAALRITQCAAEPRHALDVMTHGTYNVLEQCVANKIKRLVFASTASVYGQAQKFPTPETHHPYCNFTFYGALKMSGELMMKSFHQMFGLSYIALRFFNIYGPRMDTFGKYTEVLIRWYHLIKEGKPPCIYGDGKQSMDFIFVEDVARATVMALSSNAENESINVASGKETSLTQLCEGLLKAMGSDLKPEYLPIPEDRKKVEVMRRKADITKAKKILNFESQIRLSDGLARLVEWLDKL